MVQGPGSVPERAPLRIAFTNIPRRLWAGGYNYQRNLFEALNRHSPGTVVPVLFAGTADDPEEIAVLAGIPGVEVVRSPVFDHAATGLARATDLARAIVFGLDAPAVAAFTASKIDMVFEIRALLWLAPAVSGGRMVSGFPASTAPASVLQGCILAA